MLPCRAGCDVVEAFSGEALRRFLVLHWSNCYTMDGANGVTDSSTPGPLSRAASDPHIAEESSSLSSSLKKY